MLALIKYPGLFSRSTQQLLQYYDLLYNPKHIEDKTVTLMNKITHVAIAGANGRMGKELLTVCSEDSQINIVCALVRSGYPSISTDDAYPYVSQDELIAQKAETLIDFTLPDNSLHLLKQCIQTNTAMVIGTTGFTSEQQQEINEAAKLIPILQASNMSIGVNMTMALLKQATKMVGNDIPIAITESHHIHKKDAPSGTAITMAEEIADAGNNGDNYSIVYDEKSTDDKSTDSNDNDLQPGCITINAIREGEVVGDHRVRFILEDETIEIAHHAKNRKIFAKGAVKAAKWLSDKKPGLYSIANVLGL